MQEQVYRCTVCGHLNIKYVSDGVNVAIGGQITHWCDSMECRNKRTQSVMKRVY